VMSTCQRCCLPAAIGFTLFISCEGSISCRRATARAANDSTAQLSKRQPDQWIKFNSLSFSN
jgi:hypothetical protein